MNKFLGVVMIVMALTLAVVPLFTDCQSHGRALTLQDGRHRGQHRAVRRRA